MHSELVELRGQLAELREEVVSLSCEVARLRRLLARGSELSASRAASETDQGSERGYSFVSTPAATPLPTNLVVEPVGSIPECSGDRAVLNWTQRDRIAEGVGKFLGRALRGDHRGSSGRDANPLASRLWIVCRSITGVEYNPVRVFRTWTLAKELVKRGSSAGDSVFVGLPSQREAKTAVQSAGLDWPDIIEG